MKRPLFVMAGGFVLGEVCGLHDRSAVFMFGAALVMAAFLWAARKYGSGFPCGLLLIFLLFGLWRGNAEKMLCEREAVLRLDGVSDAVRGRVEDISEKQARVEVLIKPYDSGLRYLLVYADGGNAGNGRELSIGTEVSLKGRYSAFGEATNPGQFDYAGYYRARKLTYRYFADEIEVTGRSRNLYDSFRESLRRLSRYLSGVLDMTADPEDAGILRSLLLGDRSGMDKEVRDLYQKAGISHLLAISGLHLSLLSTVVYGALKRWGLGYWRSAILAGLALFSYCVMTGSSVSTLRALIMLLMAYLAACKGRSYDLLTALGLAASLLFFDSPYQLTQPGPLLSFLAILGIAASSALKDPHKDKKKGMSRSILNALMTSTAVQLMTAPVILWNFFYLPLYGVILNLFVLPLTGCVAASGAAGMTAGIFSPALGRFFLGTAHIILVWYDLLCRFFTKLPFSSPLLGRPSIIQTVIYYTALVALWFFIKERRPERLLLLPALIILLFPLPVTGCDILFMDVGQGDGILIRSPAGTVLVDGGSSSVNDLWGERLEPCLESLAVSGIDYAIASHAHADHVSGLYMLLSDDSPVRVKNLIVPAAGRGDENYESLIRRAENAGARAFFMQTGDILKIGKMRLTCIYPGDSGGHPDADENEHSLVIRLDYGGFSMLMGGDMTVNGENAILADESCAALLSGISVLKVAHHGSATSSSGPWLDAVSPGWAVISYGRGNSYGHPSGEILDALHERDITVYETAKDGAISLWTDGKKMRFNTFRSRDRPWP